MKFKILALSAALFCACFPGEAAPLKLPSDFKELKPDDNAPSGWVKEFAYQGGFGECRIDNADGKNVLSILTTGKKTNFYTSDMFEVHPGDRIVLSADVKGEGRFGFTLYVYDSGFIQSLPPKMFEISNRVQTVEAAFSIAPSYLKDENGKKKAVAPKLIRAVFLVDEDSLVTIRDIRGSVAPLPFRTELPENPTALEKTASNEITEYLSQVASDSFRLDGKTDVTILIGNTPFARENGMGSETFAEEEWAVKSFGNKLVINGGGRGILYGGYHFLENTCGIHWWNQDEEYVPETTRLDLPAIDQKGRPFFRFREIYLTEQRDDGGRFATRNRLNRAGAFTTMSTPFGGTLLWGPPSGVHTLYFYITEEEFGKTHPEYFGLTNGKRQTGNFLGQVCLSNPEMGKILLEKVRKYIRSGKRQAAFLGTNPPMIYDISQNDGVLACGCDACRAEIEKYGASGQLLRVLNPIAEQIAKEEPGVFLSTLAYSYSQEPPKGDLKAADNLIIRVCGGSNKVSSIYGEDGKVFRDLLGKWKNHAKNLFAWYYSVLYWDGCIGLPHPSEFFLGDTVKCYSENNIVGIFFEHEWRPLADMYDLKVFLEAKLLENPSADTDALIRLFMDKYYGPAGNKVLEYRKRLLRAVQENKGMVCGNIRLASFEYLDDAAIADCRKLMEEAAESVRENPLLLKRVNRARLGLDRWICRKAAEYPLIRNGAFLRTPPVLASAEEEKRIRAHFASLETDYPVNSTLIKEMQTHCVRELSQYHFAEKNPVPPVPPAKFAGKKYYDFPAERFFNWSEGIYKLVDAPDSESGKAVKLPADDPKLGRFAHLPWESGIYNAWKEQATVRMVVEKSKGKGFHWYRLGEVENLRESFLYLDKSWCTELRVLNDELVNKPFEIWISLKFSGPLYHPEESGENAVWIERVIFLGKTK